MVLIDTVRRYYYSPLRREQLEEPGIFERLKATSEYRLWKTKRWEAWENRAEWRALVLEVEPLLPAYELRDEAVPAMSSYEATARHKADPEPAHGVIFTSLVVRVSFLAPIYEIYESSAQVVVDNRVSANSDVGHWHYENRRRTHEISEEFQPAADTFAHAIEERYGYWRVDPKLLQISLVNTAMWESAWNTGTLGEALFSEYRL